MFVFWENRSLVSGVPWHLHICKVSLIFPKWWSLQDLRLWLWCCWMFEILHTITAWFTSSLSSYLLWGREIEVRDCPCEVHFVIYDDHKMWFHFSHVFTSVQQRVYWQPRYVTYQMFLNLWMHTDLLCWSEELIFENAKVHFL
jgi:hypothetical protein